MSACSVGRKDLSVAPFSLFVKILFSISHLMNTLCEKVFMDLRSTVPILTREQQTDCIPWGFCARLSHLYQYTVNLAPPSSLEDKSRV